MVLLLRHQSAQSLLHVDKKMHKKDNSSISVLDLLHFKTINSMMETPEDTEAAVINSALLIEVVKINALGQADDCNPLALSYLE